MKVIGIDPGLSGALALLEVANGDTTLVDVIDRLRKNPHMPRLSYFEWELVFADLRNELTSSLAELIDHCDSPFDIAQRVKNELIGALANTLMEGKK